MWDNKQKYITENGLFSILAIGMFFFTQLPNNCGEIMHNGDAQCN